MTSFDGFGTRARLLDGVDYFRLDRLRDLGVGDPGRLPVTVKILLENLLRHSDKPFVSESDIAAVCRWDGQGADGDSERPFLPSRVLLQDFTGIPAVVDLAAMRSAVARVGGDPQLIDPVVPVDLVVDHSLQVDAFGTPRAFRANIDLEYERNRERYVLLRWAQHAFRDFRVVPPGMGIVHQVNLEYLARVVQVRRDNGAAVAFPDTLVGTDSHTTMINGIGVLGWGVGGIEAEAVMLGQPLFLLSPVVVGVCFRNELPAGTTATDLVLTLTEMLRGHGVVNKFVEFCGEGLGSMSAADRATLANMSPEYGATAALFPVDSQTLRYLLETGRDPAHVDLVERYAREQGMFRSEGENLPLFSELLELDLGTVVPSVAGPRRPQDRVSLSDVWRSFTDVHPDADIDEAYDPEVRRFIAEGGNSGDPMDVVEAHPHGNHKNFNGVRRAPLNDGSVVIAAITSCTNTSNPSVMIAAGLLARKAVERGLRVPAHVKTSLAPGSRVVTDYLDRSGLTPALEALRFHLVGYGCTTCIGNSGPLPQLVEETIEQDDLAVVAVLSGNRNFEGRIHPHVRAAYLASPPQVIAYAIAGSIRTDLTRDPLGRDQHGREVYLRDIWPSGDEIAETLNSALDTELYGREYGRIFEGDEHWKRLPVREGREFEWEAESTYVREPPFFVDLAHRVPGDIEEARVLALLGNSVTTDHISPAGSISFSSPAGAYLRDRGVRQREFNSYGARRGNHEVMLRGTFANVRMRNRLVEREGGYTLHLPSGDVMTIFGAAQRYAAEGVPLIVIAGREYGSGSSRDWAAKGPALLGVRAVIAESFERIHRSNLVGLGILPLQFKPGESAESLGLSGRERYSIRGVNSAGPRAQVAVVASGEDGREVHFDTLCRLDSETDVQCYRAGGILLMTLRQLMP